LKRNMIVMLLILLLPIVAVNAQVSYFSDSYENGFDPWDSTMVWGEGSYLKIIENASFAYRGNYCMEHYLNSGIKTGASSGAFLIKYLPNVTMLYVRVMVKLPTLDAESSIEIYSLRSEEGYVIASCYLLPVPHYWLFHYGHADGHTSLVTYVIPEINVWQHVEIMAKVGNGTGEVAFWVNDVELERATNINNTVVNEHIIAGVEKVHIGGGIGWSGEFKFYTDYVEIRDEYVGPIIPEFSYPTVLVALLVVSASLAILVCQWVFRACVKTSKCPDSSPER